MHLFDIGDNVRGFVYCLVVLVLVGEGRGFTSVSWYRNYNWQNWVGSGVTGLKTDKSLGWNRDEYIRF